MGMIGLKEWGLNDCIELWQPRALPHPPPPKKHERSDALKSRGPSKKELLPTLCSLVLPLRKLKFGSSYQLLCPIFMSWESKKGLPTQMGPAHGNRAEGTGWFPREEGAFQSVAFSLITMASDVQNSLERREHCPGGERGEGFADHYSFIRTASSFLCPFRQLLLASEKSQSPVISGINHARAQGEPSRGLSFTQLKGSEPAVCGWLSSWVCSSASFQQFSGPCLVPASSLYCLLGDALCGFCTRGKEKRKERAFA